MPIDTSRVYTTILPGNIERPWQPDLLNQLKYSHLPEFYFFAMSINDVENKKEILVSMLRTRSFDEDGFWGFFRLDRYVCAVWKSFDVDLFRDTEIKEEIKYKEVYSFINGREEYYTPTEEVISWKLEYREKQLRLIEFGFNLY